MNNFKTLNNTQKLFIKNNLYRVGSNLVIVRHFVAAGKEFNKKYIKCCNTNVKNPIYCDTCNLCNTFFCDGEVLSFDNYEGLMKELLATNPEEFL